MEVDWLHRWWRQPDHHDWLSAYLAARGLQRFVRYMTAAIMTSFGAVPLLMLWSPSGPDSPLTRALSILVSAACVVMAVLWLTQWPTRQQSIAFTVVASACIAVTCLVQSNPSTGLQGCTAFAAMGAYVAFFHTSRTLLPTLLGAAATALICAANIAAHLDPFGAASKLLVLTVGVLVVPFSAQVLVRFLGIDALNSDTDPLTGLPNRRGFYRSMHALAVESIGNRHAVLAVVMIDLDAFKRVNDTGGHAAGDQTLITVADILRRTRRGDSVIARIGGEEFVAGVVGPKGNAVGLAERLCREIPATPWKVTASVGVAAASLARVPDAGIGSFIQNLVESADRAMYTAKRAGGNQVYVAGQARQTRPVYVESPMPRRATATGNVPSATVGRAPSPATSKAAAPAAVPSELVNLTPTPVTIARPV